MGQLVSLGGLVFMLFLAWLCSANRRQIAHRAVAWGVVLQMVFAFVVLRTTPGRAAFTFMNDAIVKLLSFQEEGAKFVFGVLGLAPGSPGSLESLGFIFAFQILPTIIFFSSLMGVLYYLGVMQRIVWLFAVVMKRFMGTSGAESLSAAANIFVGQTEAPLLVKPYLDDMTDSELMCVMVGGMATVAGGVLAAYVVLLRPYLPDIAGHLLAASVMSAPAALAIAKIMMPETGEPKTMGEVKVVYDDPSVNVIDAAANGATTGMYLAFNVGTMLVAFMGLLALANFLVAGGIELVTGYEGATLEHMLGYALAPLAWVMGVEWKDCQLVGQLLGEKTILNEFVSYGHFAEALKADASLLSERSRVIASYALCGFANFLSIGIQIGGIGAIAPGRKHDVARLGLRALIGGSLAAFMTATVAGMLL